MVRPRLLTFALALLSLLAACRSEGPGPATCTDECATADARACATEPGTVGTCRRSAGGCLRLEEITSCPSPAQGCDPATGTCVCGAVQCASGTTRCAPDGTRVTCGLDVAGGCLSFPAGGGEACGGVHVCEDTGSGAACVCPAPGDRAGQGCAQAGALACDAASGDIDVCRLDPVTGCLAWAIETGCSGGLTCGNASTSGGPLVCECPRHASTDGAFYADAAVGGSGPAPSGVASPAACRFGTLAEALAAAAASTPQDARRAIAAGSSPPAGWRAWNVSIACAVGDVVLPQHANGHWYRAESVGGAGTSGTSEPSWPTGTGASVTDGDVTWQEAGLVPGMTFDEVLPLVVPAFVDLTTDACEAGRCSPRLYLIPYDGTTALQVIARVKGFTLRKTGSASAAPGTPAISATGSVEYVAVYGDSGTARIPVGIQAAGARLEGVDVSGAGTTGIATSGFTRMSGVTVEGTSGDGIVVQGSLTSFWSSIHDNAGAGVSGGGLAQFEYGSVFANGGIGISATYAWGISDNDIHHNGDTGLAIQGWGQELHIFRNRVHENGASGNVGGVHLLGDAPALLHFVSNRVYANRGHQILIEEPTAPLDPKTWTVDGTAYCDAPLSANTIACKDTSGAWAGLAAAGWAQVSARFNSWDSASPAAGVDYAAAGSSSIDASSPCAARLEVTCP